MPRPPRRSWRSSPGASSAKVPGMALRPTPSSLRARPTWTGCCRKRAGPMASPDARPVSSAAMKEAVDRLNKIAQQLDVQGQMNQASSALSQLQLSVAQRSALSAGRFGQQAANSSMPSPETGNTVMPGGVMFRAGAVAKESMRSQDSEGAKTGDAAGESQADPLFGAKPIASRRS